MLLGLTGCNGILDVSPKDQLSDVDAVFADPGLAEGFLNDIYGGLGHGLYEIMLGSLTDETHFIHGYGTGQLKRALTGFLQQHPLVARFATAPPEQGGGGVTVVELKD